MCVLALSVYQINQVLSKLYENKKIANATHNMVAYRLITETSAVYQGCDDDGETHAGSRMLHLLQVGQSHFFLLSIKMSCLMIFGALRHWLWWGM